MLKRLFLSDAETVQRIRQNERSVMGDLFNANLPPVMRFIKRNGGRQDDAQDMLQEAIIVLWQNVNKDSFVLSAKISTYLFSIARNKWLAELRRRKNHATPLETVPDIGIDDDSLAGMIDADEQKKLYDAMERLAKICKEILLFYYFEQRNMNDIAKLTGLANANVAKAKKYQCVKSLQKLIV